jgi:hypothetical protein
MFIQIKLLETLNKKIYDWENKEKPTMPYIKSNNDRRTKLQTGDIAQNAGELNYQIFYYIKHNEGEALNKMQVALFVYRFLGTNPNYQKYNDMAGCLILCYKEIGRRLNNNTQFLLDIIDSYDMIIAYYEEEKIIENGDVE